MNAFEKLTTARDAIAEILALALSAERPHYWLIEDLGKQLRKVQQIRERGERNLASLDFPVTEPEPSWFFPPASIRDEFQYRMWRVAFSKMLADNDIEIPLTILDAWFDRAMDVGYQAGVKSVERQELPSGCMVVPPGTGSHDIVAERTISRIRYGDEHDDAHKDGELLMAAQSYLIAARVPDRYGNGIQPGQYPFERTSFKFKDARDALVKAGAFIASELDRLDRRKAQERLYSLKKWVSGEPVAADSLKIQVNGETVAELPVYPLKDGGTLEISSVVPIAGAGQPDHGIITIDSYAPPFPAIAVDEGPLVPAAVQAVDEEDIPF